MAGMGPPPKASAQRRRRNTSASVMVRLPASGRSGPVPRWPLSDASALELETWQELWRLPQAVAWEQAQLARVVARYVRAVVVAEARSATGADKAEARQLEDRLGLSPMALLRLRWEIVDDVDDDAGRADVESPAAMDEFSERLRRRAFGAG